MKTVFADALYWVALVRPNDQWGQEARRAKERLGNVRIVTTDEVLGEFLTGLSKVGPHLRQQAGRMVRRIQDNPNVQVVYQSHDSFMKGLGLYEQRLDKAYSLVDCVSLPFDLGEHTRLAVKIVDDRGIESLKIVEVG